jgi:hypothetical protein
MYVFIYFFGTLTGMAIGGLLASMIVYEGRERIFPRLLLAVVLIGGGGYTGFLWCVPLLNQLLSAFR